MTGEGLRTLRFTKMHGLGNDFLLVDAGSAEQLPWPALGPRLCDRHRGVGADGVLLVGQAAAGRLSMRLVNADGGTAEMCGNGVRCAALWAAARGLAGAEVGWETEAGPVATRILGSGQVLVDMGAPRFAPAEIPVLSDGAQAPDIAVDLAGGAGASTPVRLHGLAVGMGNPHCVVALDAATPWSLDDAPAGAIAAAVAALGIFPAGVNVELVAIDAPGLVRQRTVERGVGETDACGTGACASVAALRRAGRIAPSGEVRVELRGGELTVDWPGEGSVLMTGPAQTVFEGEVALNAAGDGPR